MSKPGSPGNPNLFCALSQEQLFRKLGSYASGMRREALANAVATMLSQTGWPVPELQKSLPFAYVGNFQVCRERHLQSAHERLAASLRLHEPEDCEPKHPERLAKPDPQDPCREIRQAQLQHGFHFHFS